VASSPSATDPHTTDAPSWDDPDYIRPPGGEYGVGRALGSLHLALLAMTAIAWVWTITGAGYRADGQLLCLFAGAVIATVWLVSVLVAMVRFARSGRRPGKVVWVTPLVAMVLVVLTATHLPTRLRFEVARSDFDAYALEVLTAADEVDTWERPGEPLQEGRDRDLQHPEVPDSLGGIPLIQARVVPEGLIIYDGDGADLEDAGYAYLPLGARPTSDSSSGPPTLRPLGGDWYSFTGTW